MWCARYRRQLSAYADGELHPAEARAVRDHVARCEHCAREHEGLRKLARLTGMVPEEDLPAGLHARIMTRISAASVAPPGRIPRPRPVSFHPWVFTAFGAATSAAVIAGVWQVQARPARPGRPAENPVSVRHVAPKPEEPIRDVEPAKPEKPLAALPQPEPRVAEAPAAASPERDETTLASARAEAPKIETPSSVRQAACADPSALPIRKIRPASRLVRPDAAAESELPKKDGRPQASPAPTGKPATDKPDGDSGGTIMTQGTGPGMPGDPVVNATGGAGRPDPVMVGMEGSGGSTRMAGMMMTDPEPLPEEDEGLRLRMLLEERNRSVPQPPLANPAQDRRGKRKSL